MAEAGPHAQDIVAVRFRSAAGLIPLLMLLVALLIALGLEFVNRLHDSANEVATVIYDFSLPAQIAVVWSGSSLCLLVVNALIRRPVLYRDAKTDKPPGMAESPTK
jgi:hypothetical protein